jgi:hypothetical protein
MEREIIDECLVLAKSFDLQIQFKYVYVKDIGKGCLPLKANATDCFDLISCGFLVSAFRKNQGRYESCTVDVQVLLLSCLVKF